MHTSPHVINVDSNTFDQEVLARSHEVPVVVDFWAEWCGPCRTLGPILEEAVAQRGGDVVLAKLDTDANQELAQQFRIQGIPAVKAFRDGQVINEFTGALPAAAVNTFLDEIVPSAADRLVTRARDEAETDPVAAQHTLEEALELSPGHPGATLLLAELVLDNDPARTLQLIKPLRPAPEAEVLATRADLALADGDIVSLRAVVEDDPDDGQARIDLARLEAAAGNPTEAVELLLFVVEAAGPEKEPAREQLVALFDMLGDQDPLVVAARPRLARALF